MTDGSSPDPRPRPQYGEYATPEEQRARIQHPDATWSLETGQAPESTGSEPTEKHGWPIDTTPAPPMAPPRATDRIVTFALLIVGAFNVVFSAISYFNLASLADQAMSILGIPGEFTNLEAAQLWGPIAAAVLIVGYLLTAFFAWRAVRAGRLSWWIPLVGAIVTYIAVYICLAVPLLGDPAFVQFATTSR